MNEQITWTAADGTITILTDPDNGYAVLGDGTRGLRSVTYDVATQRYAGIDGEQVLSIRAAGNQPTLGLLISADSDADFITRARGLRRAMRPQAGAGVLGIRRSTGELRELPCYCIGGFEGDESTGVAAPGRWWKLALKFYAPTPWWLGAERVLTFGLGAAVGSFFPITPMTLSSSAVQGLFSVDCSDSDAPIYPVWSIAGPGSALTLTNQTTNQTLTMSLTLTASQTLLIDTRPGHQTVRLTDGTSLLSAVTSNPALWPLIESVNTISAQLTGATSSTRITLTYRPQYAGI